MQRPNNPEVYALVSDNPTMSNTDLAKFIASSYPDSYETVEKARSAVRLYRGAMGKKNREEVKAPILKRVSVPKSDAKSPSLFNVPYSDFPVLIGADAHIPYHDEKALEIFLERARGAKTIILLGDWMDMYSISSFIIDPTAKTIPQEIDIMRDFLASLRDTFPDKRIIYKLGNHEERLDRYMKTLGAKIFGLVSLAEKLEADESRIEIVESRQMMKVGALHVIHGHELGRSVFSPVNPARGLYLKAKKSALCAHYHQTSEHVEKNLDDKIESCWTIGCLCYMKPDYSPVNKWNHGFAEIVQDEGMYSVKNYKIVNGRVV